MFFFGPVRHDVNSNLVVNVSLDGHILFPGFVKRELEGGTNGFFIKTHGEGTGRLGLLNVLFADTLWSGIDKSIKNWVQ